MLKRALIFSSLLTLPCAGKALGVDVVLGGALHLELDFGVEKSDPLSFGEARSSVAVSLAMNGSTDAGLNYGANLGFASSKVLQVSPYVSSLGKGYLAKATVPGRTDIQGAVYPVSGGGALNNDVIVAVKIASDWIGVSEQQTAYHLEIPAQASAICKLAGKANFVGAGNPDFQLSEVDTVLGQTLPNGEFGSFVSLPNSGWLHPGRLLHVAGSMANNTTLGTPAYIEGTTTIQYFGQGGVALVGLQLTAPDPISTIVPDKVLASRYNVKVYGDGETTDEVQFSNAEILNGPFMSVNTVHGSDKLVLGAVCLGGSTDTKYFLDVANNGLLTRSSAQIFIEGGFGVLELTSAGEAGSVTTISSIDPKADITGTDVTLSYNGAPGYLLRPGFAINLEDPKELLAHGRLHIAGFYADFDMRLDLEPFSGNPIISSQGWELATGYSGDLLTFQLGVNSDDDIGVMGALDLGALGLHAEVATPAVKDHLPYRHSYLLSATYEADDFSVSGSIDEERRVTVAASYDLSILSVYGDFDFMSQEGRIGTTISF